MGRKPNPQRRRDLLGAVVEYVLTNGVADLSLRPLAEELGVSTFSLAYHFGSKEGVVVAALTEAERLERERFRAMLDEPAGDRTPGAMMRRFWSWWLSSEANLAYTRLYFEVYAAALRDPAHYRDFPRRSGVHPWLDLTEEALGMVGVAGPEAKALASMIVGTFMGLQLDLLTTGDRARATSAVDVAASMVDHWVAQVAAPGVAAGPPSS
jgi:AcrR family transcriptional regulator